MEFDVPANNSTTAPVEWAEIKSRILKNLDIELEYEEMGLRWVGPKGGNSKGVRVCKAMDREDARPSACVFLKSGVYHDSGSGINLSFFDFALKYGKQRSTRWVDLVRHYADKAGVETRRSLVVRSVGRVQEAVYEYRDAGGVLKYGVFRYRNPNGTKSFTQHPWTGDRGWGYGSGCMDGVEPIPYRVADLSDNPYGGVYVVEGERDVDRLKSHGFIATTSHGGASNVEKTWGNPRFVEWFKGRHVILIPDNDDVGRQFMNEVGKSLSGIAESIRILELPGVPLKGDISDWLDMGNSGEDLERLLASDRCKPWVAAEDIPDAERNGQSSTPIIWASQITVKIVEWLWPGRIPRGKQTTLAGPGGVGKSFLLCDLASRVSAGREWPYSNGECAPVGNVLYISGEDDPDDTLVPRMIEQGADLERIAFLKPEELIGFNLAGPIFKDFADRAIEAMGGCVLIIIDPPSSFLAGIDENSNAEVRGVLTPMKEWASEHDAAIIFNAHVNKGNGKKIEVQTRVMGSVAWVNGPRFSHLVTCSEDDPNTRLFVPLKSNIWKRTPALSFTITQTEHLARLEWTGEVDIDAGTAINGREEPLNGEDTGQKRIEAFLVDRFKQKREWRTSDLMDVMRAEFGAKPGGTVDRAKKNLGIQSRKNGRTWEMYVDPDWIYFQVPNNPK